MYRVVIIDDEPIIVDGLTNGIQWDKWDCQVVGTAYDGEEGLNLVRTIKPDILISDISMPKMDGLAMIAGFKSEFPKMQITILTGFREFDYAQRAIKLGVTRFLLKPSKFAELEEAITVMTDKLNESRKNLDGGIVSVESLEEEEISSGANSFIVDNAMAYISEHYKEKIKLVDVADQIFVSQWHLSKLLNKHLNQNFSEILNGVRIEKAVELLRDPSYRISDIAEEVGFQDLAHFSRVFKKIKGESANEYRNHLNEK